MDRIVKKYEQFNDQDPYDEEIWDDTLIGQNIEEVMGRCYDKIGYYDVTQKVFQWLHDNDYLIFKRKQ